MVMLSEPRHLPACFYRECTEKDAFVWELTQHLPRSCVTGQAEREMPRSNSSGALRPSSAKRPSTTTLPSAPVAGLVVFFGGEFGIHKTETVFCVVLILFQSYNIYIYLILCLVVLFSASRCLWITRNDGVHD